MRDAGGACPPATTAATEANCCIICTCLAATTGASIRQTPTYDTSIPFCSRFLIAFSYELSKKEGRVGKDAKRQTAPEARVGLASTSKMTPGLFCRHAGTPAVRLRVAGVPELLEVRAAGYFVKAQDKLVDQRHLVSDVLLGHRGRVQFWSLIVMHALV